MVDPAAVNWDDYRFFDEVVRAGSIRGAARVLGVDHATVSRRIASLETAFSAKLLVRAAGGVKLTEAGDELRLAAAAVRRELQSAQRTISGRDTPLSGRIRVSTHAVLGTKFLIPSIVAFRRAHPKIDVTLDLSADLVDLAMNQADVAVRVTQVPPDETIARRTCGFGYAVYGAPSYLSCHDPVADPTNCEWIGWDERGPYPTAIKDELFSEVPIRDRFPAIVSQLEAAAAGLGLAALPCFLADQDHRLRRVSFEHEATSVFVLRHPDHRSTSRVRAFYEHIRRFIEDNAALLEGTSSQQRDALAPSGPKKRSRR